jgi:hypothetical protein
MTEVRARVAAVLADPEDVVLARAILGTDSVEEISSRVESYCRRHLGRAVAGCLDFTQSVGSVFTLSLDDGSAVVLKAHALGRGRLGMAATLESLAAVYRVQSELAEQGLPCAQVIRPPVLWETGAVVAMQRLHAPAPDDAHRPVVRRAMAESLADFVRRAEPFRGLPHLPISQLPGGRLFPPPHNALYDFSLPGGEWIDSRARKARERIDALGDNLVVAHSDYSAANVRVSGEKVTAIYDFDSVALIDEMRCLASTALHFTYQPHSTGWCWAGPEESAAFIEDYGRARGRAFSLLERQRLAACAVYAMAYTARCEHALDPDGSRSGGMRELLNETSEAA